MVVYLSLQAFLLIGHLSLFVFAALPGLPLIPWMLICSSKMRVPKGLFYFWFMMAFIMMLPYGLIKHIDEVFMRPFSIFFLILFGVGIVMTRIAGKSAAESGATNDLRDLWVYNLLLFGAIAVTWLVYGYDIDPFINYFAG
ncbi:MAG: hypothetical protein MUC92_13100 [Fimbriimonadaceae bacterium]|jgi:hypothetical protein|nr:hypothetical protein [Fimbriimonadaceae bacterium]